MLHFHNLQQFLLLLKLRFFFIARSTMRVAIVLYYLSRTRLGVSLGCSGSILLPLCAGIKKHWLSFHFVCRWQSNQPTTEKLLVTRLLTVWEQTFSLLLPNQRKHIKRTKFHCGQIVELDLLQKYLFAFFFPDKVWQLPVFLLFLFLLLWCYDYQVWLHFLYWICGFLFLLLVL